MAVGELSDEALVSALRAHPEHRKRVSSIVLAVEGDEGELKEADGNFQIDAAQKADNGTLSVALGAFHFRASDNRGKFLFWSWGAEEVSFWTAVRKMRLNPDLYAARRSAVVAKLKADAAGYVDELEIKYSTGRSTCFALAPGAARRAPLSTVRQITFAKQSEC